MPKEVPRAASPARGGPADEELSQELQRVLASECFSKSQRLRRFLEYVVGCVDRGEVDQIREYLIAVEVFHRKPSFDQRLDPIVRVEASRLRTKLKAYYESEGKDRPLTIELPRGTYVPLVRRRSEPATAEAAEAAPPAGVRARKPRLKPIFAGIGLAVLLATSAALWQRKAEAGADTEPVRVTFDSGLSAYPALSPDGKLLAYSSDHGGQGNLSIWVQPLTGGEPTRLTRNTADDREPSFSPDSSEVVFRSERDGGGIYAVSVFGGSEPRPIVKQGYRPRYSPDGAWILYWMRDECWGPGQIFVVPARGGATRRLAADFEDAQYPLWSPDGRHVLFCGTRRSGQSEDEHDWWVIPLAGGPAVKTGAAESLTRNRGRKRSLADLPNPAVWTDRGIVFSARRRDSENLYVAAITAGKWRVASEPRQLTSTTGLHLQPAVAAGRLAFVNAKISSGVWSLPVGTIAGKAIGLVAKLSFGLYDSHPSLSGDGRLLAFVSERAGRHDIWLRDLGAGTESALTSADTVERCPMISPDSSRVVYRVNRSLHIVSTRGGESERVCEDCGRPTGWSPDGRYILFEPRAAVPPLGAFELATRNRFEAVRDAQAGIHSGRFSPDGRWIAFHVKEGAKPPRLYVAPFRPGKPALRQDWIEVGPGHTPGWSPDGGLLYFLCQRDGFRCIWAQRLQKDTKRPEGSPFAVHHFHASQRSLMMNLRANPFETGFSVGPNKLVFAMDEVSGNIWLMQL